MESLTSEEINKILFFTKFQHILVTKSQLEELVVDNYTMTQIRTALTNTENSYNLINQSSLKAIESEQIKITTTSQEFPLQDKTIEYKSKVNNNESNKNFYTNLELLIKCLIFNL